MRRTAALAFTLGLAAGLGGFLGCAEERPRHVLVILVDTLRADHTSLAGSERDTTPALRALAAEGTRFTHHLANAPWTKPSVASILTGLLPPAHGSQWGDFNRVKNGEVDVLAPGFDTLPEILKRHGFATAAFMTNTTITPQIGYAQGFDRFEQLKPTLRGDLAALEGAARVLDSAEQPTFVWCHLMAPHNYVVPKGRKPHFHSPGRTPVQPHEAFGARLRKDFRLHTREQAMDAYDETVLWVDERVSALVGYVLARHPDTLVILTSDHGEEFGEHGGYFHARTLYSELIHVPLVIWGPGVPKGEVVEHLTQSVDLLPTVLDRLGLDPVPGQGRSVFTPADDADTAVYAEKRNGMFAMRAWITPDGKLLEWKPDGTPGEKPPISEAGTWQYYVGPVGPDGPSQLGGLPAEEVTRRRARLEETYARSVRIHEEHAGGAARRTLEDDEIEALRALGYAEGPGGGSGGTATKEIEPDAAPADQP